MVMQELGVLCVDYQLFLVVDWLMSEGIKIPYEIDSALADSRHAGYGASVLAIDGEAVAALHSPMMMLERGFTKW